MDQIIGIIFDCLTSTTSTYITIIVPFIGALYIYKRTSRTAAESKIFEIGRRISDILETRLVSVPWVAINIQSFIERHVPFELFEDRDEAITETLKKSLSAFLSEKEASKAQELAERITTIIHYRYDSLTPVGVSWSGRGSVYGINGVDKLPKNTFFPFGTLLYRQWINDFSKHYNDIWRGFGWARANDLADRLHYHIDKKEEFYNHLYDDIIKWADDINKKLEAINKLHSQLITQIQIIDFAISEADHLKSLKIIGIYLFLLAASGFILPTAMYNFSLLNISNLLALVAVSIFLIAIIPLRLLAKKDNAIRSKRLALYSNLKNNLKLPREKSAKYYSGFLQAFCQMEKTLKIPPALIRKSRKIIVDMARAGELSEKIHNELQPYFTHLKGKESGVDRAAGSDESGNNPAGTSISTINLIDPSYDFSRVVKKIQASASYLEIIKAEHWSSMRIFKYQLSTPEIKGSIVDGLLSIRNEFKNRDEVTKLLSTIDNINAEAESLSEVLTREIRNGLPGEN